MEDIIAYLIVAILLLSTVYGTILIRRRLLRIREEKLKQHLEQVEKEAEQRRLREQQRIKDREKWQAQARLYSNGAVGRQEYDLNTNTVRTSVHNPKTNTTKYVTTPAAQIAPGTVLPQTTNNFGSDLLTIMALSGLTNSHSSTPTHSQSTDFGLDDSDSRKSVSSSFSSSDSSSSWSDSSSSDSGPSSDW